MKIDIYYFSGTGNTAWVVKHLAEHLGNRGDEVTVTSCEDMQPADVVLDDCDVLGIAFPVYASFAPSLVRDFMAGLPVAEGQPVFIVTTAGAAAGDTAWYEAKPLQGRGYEPLVLANVVVANNLRLPILSPLSIPSLDEMAPKLERALAKVERLAAWIHDREHHVEGAGFFGRLLGVAQRMSVEPFEALAFGGFFADEDCTQCGWCVKHCPVHNIEMTDEGVKFLDHCMLCMRCYSFCPSQAIQSTNKTKDVKKYPRYSGPEGRPYPVG
jgi:ferredoxin/flavodoxin